MHQKISESSSSEADVPASQKGEMKPTQQGVEATEASAATHPEVSNKKLTRPNFINLNGASKSCVQINGHSNNEQLSRDCESEVSENFLTEAPVNENDCISKESDISVTRELADPHKNASGTKASVPKLNHSCDATKSSESLKEMAPLIPKISSRFVSPDATNSPCDSMGSVDSTPWNIDGTETIVENPFKRCQGVLGTLKNRVPSFLERELTALKEENKQLKASLKEVRHGLLWLEVIEFSVLTS